MKKALSLLLAVLMLVSLFSGMAFADDDVIVEEPADDVIAEEPAATDEFVGDDYVEATDAFVEEYTDEGSFEATDAYTPVDIRYYLNNGYVIDRVEDMSGKVLGTTFESIPTKHESECYVWIKKDLGIDPNQPGLHIYGNPEKYYVVVPHNWGPWVTVFEEDASCTTGGMAHKERTCQGDEWDPKCRKVEKTDSFYVPMQKHAYVQDETYTCRNGLGDDRAIVVKPTCKAPGKGHWVCSVCGAPAPDLFYDDAGLPVKGDYDIPLTWIGNRNKIWDPNKDDIKDLDPIFHAWGDWTVIKPASCETFGTKAHYCNICNMQQTEDILPYLHGFVEPLDAMAFDHLEWVDCTHYVEVWTCTVDGCKTGLKGTTQFSTFVGFDTTKGERTFLSVNNRDKKLDVKNLTAEDKGKCFLWTVDYAATYLVDDYNNEHYEHHRFGPDWTLIVAPKCCEPGKESRKCTICGVEEIKPIEALEPMYGTQVYTDYDTVNGERVYFHWVCCTREKCQEGIPAGQVAAPKFGKLTKADGVTPIDKTDPRYFTQANVLNPNQVMLVDHDWTDWTCYVKPVEGSTKGHWTRTCKYTDTTNAAGQLENCLANEEFVGTQAEFDAMVNPPHPVLKTGIYKEDGAFKLYEMGMFDADFTGIFDGYNDVLGQTGKWYVENGIWKNNAMGATLVGSTWYFLANGKVQEVTQLAEYQGKWFYVVNGVIDTSKTALVDYNGGKFVVAAGRIVNEYNGLWQNAKSIGGDDSWYYVANGQVQTQYTGLVLYDGEWFYVENGRLVPYNGEVEYDGEIFNVKEGMVVAA